MSSGRDEMLSRWTQEEKKQYIPVKTPLERMEAYRDTLLVELERLEYHIKELQDEQKTI
jgi:hypothetical protein